MQLFLLQLNAKKAANKLLLKSITLLKVIVVRHIGYKLTVSCVSTSSTRFSTCGLLVVEVLISITITCRKVKVCLLKMY